MSTSLQYIFKVPYNLQCLLNYFLYILFCVQQKNRENKQLRNKINDQNIKKRVMTDVTLINKTMTFISII